MTKAIPTLEPSGDNQKLDQRMDDTDKRNYDFIVEYYYAETKYRGPAPAVTLTGQRGIGESLHRGHRDRPSVNLSRVSTQERAFFRYGAMYGCLSGRRSVIWVYRKGPYMFVEGGVYDMGTQCTAQYTLC